MKRVTQQYRYRSRTPATLNVPHRRFFTRLTSARHERYATSQGSMLGRATTTEATHHARAHSITATAGLVPLPPPTADGSRMLGLSPPPPTFSAGGAAPPWLVLLRRTLSTCSQGGYRAVTVVTEWLLQSEGLEHLLLKAGHARWGAQWRGTDP